MPSSFAFAAAPYELGLLFAAGLICALAAYAAFGLHARALVTGRMLPRLGRLSAAALAMGCGLWVTQFIALIEIQEKMRVSIDAGLTFIAFFIVISVTWIGFALALWRPSFAINGGALVAVAAGGMHGVGLAAMTFSGPVVWDTTYVGASIVIAMALGAAALPTAMRSPAPRHRCLGAGLLALAVLGLHFMVTAGALQVHSPIPLLGGNSDYAVIEYERAAPSAAAARIALSDFHRRSSV